MRHLAWKWDKRTLEPDFPISWAKFWRIVLQEVAGTASGIIRIDYLARTLPDVAATTIGSAIGAIPATMTLTTVIVGIAVLVMDGVHVIMSAMARMSAMPFAASGTTLSAALRTSFVLMQQAAVHFVTASTAGNCQHRNEGPNDVFHGR